MELHEVLPGLEVLGGAGAPYFAALTFDEHGDYTANLPISVQSEGLVGELYNLFRSATSAGLLALSVEQRASGALNVRITCDSRVGFCSGDDAQGRRYFIRVRPKVAPEVMLELGHLAEVVPPIHDGDVSLNQGAESTLVEWTLRAFHRALVGLLNGGGLRSSHETVDAELQNKLRGRLRLPRYVTNLAKGRFDRLPVTYPSLELDNSFNRQLLSVIRLAGVLSRIHPDTLDLVDRFQAAERRFVGVSTAPPTKASRIWPASLPRPLQHYRAALQFGQMVLEQSSYDAQQGPLRASAVTMDMNTVYERAFFRGLHALVPSARFQEEWQVQFREAARPGELEAEPVHRRSTSLSYIPDILIPPTAELKTIIMDTKWKRDLARLGETRRPETGPPSSKAPNTEDVFQVTAYAIEALRRFDGREPHGCVAVLVYPTVQREASWITEYMTGDRTITVVATGWHLSMPVRASIEELWATVQEIAERPH